MCYHLVIEIRGTHNFDIVVTRSRSKNLICNLIRRVLVFTFWLDTFGFGTHVFSVLSESGFNLAIERADVHGFIIAIKCS